MEISVKIITPPPTPYPTRRLLLLLSLLVLFCVLLWLILYISLYFLYTNISGIGYIFIHSKYFHDSDWLKHMHNSP